MNCVPEVLVESENFCISRCKCCKRTCIYYRNLMVSFNAPEFKTFSTLFCKINFAHSAALFPDGEPYVIINTCHEDIQFVFNEEHFEEFKDMLQQAALILELRSILK